jgi:hypothetical protein
VASGGGEQRSTTSAPAPQPTRAPSTPVRLVARRVERIRGLRFDRIPRVRRVTPAQAARAGLADFDRSYPVARRHADEAMLELLGAVPPGTDLRREYGLEVRDQVGGYYDPRTKALAVVAGPTSGGALGDIVLAHELNHALEDQRFGLRDEGSPAALDDGAVASTGLVEGTATAVMYAYAQRYLDSAHALSDLLSAALQTGTGAELPRFLQDTLIWPYEGGLAFVNGLYRRLHGWGLVDYALRRRRPATTEQVLHPDKYLAAERPLPVRPPAGPGAGWRLAARGTLGEFDTRELLRIAHAPDADEAAAGWGGGRYALWSRGPRHALVLTWRWDTPRDARQAAAALAVYRGFAARRAPVALATRGDTTALGLAPVPPLARRLASAGVSAGRQQGAARAGASAER